MKLERWATGDAIHFRIHGDLDALSAGALRSAFATVPDERPREVELDLKELKLIDSSGAGAIVWLFKQLRRHGSDLRVSGLNGQPRAVFEILGLNRVFRVA
jgi:anti-sigma B factor antagonist